MKSSVMTENSPGAVTFPRGRLSSCTAHLHSRIPIFRCSYRSFIYLNDASFLKDPLSSVQFSSVTQSCPTLCDPMNRRTPGLPVHHQLPESTQTHVHWVSDAIQLSHPLLSPSPPTFNLSQRQGLFKWGSSSHQVAKVMELQLQHQSFQWTPRIGWTGWILLQSKGLGLVLRQF